LAFVETNTKVVFLMEYGLFALRPMAFDKLSSKKMMSVSAHIVT